MRSSGGSSLQFAADWARANDVKHYAVVIGVLLFVL